MSRSVSLIAQHGLGEIPSPQVVYKCYKDIVLRDSIAGTVMFLNHTNPEYQLGVREIDTQHIHLIKLIDELHEALTAKARKETMTKMVRHVLEETKDHFRSEEHLMSQHGFPGRGNHHIEHVTLMKKTEQLRRRVRAGELDVAVKTHDDLSKWIKRHISSADRKLATFLLGKGVS